eukprot:TRINITY_DN92961_c0_g1_i1.p1 TRINITY_DN92961_c0_g1~~TRINITY_DN92961_c0_g1_i1.p1  ORF type:complete len:847 (+),score=195.60 TRINITY_DN92961_c0_g1_i1:110-2650(+)
MFIVCQRPVPPIAGAQDNAGSTSPTSASAPTARVSVLTPCCKKPIEGVPVFVAGKRKGVSDSAGFAHISLPPGRHAISADADGNNPSFVDVPPSKELQDVNLTSGGELFLFLTDFSFDDEFKDALMICSSRDKVPDEEEETGPFAGSASAPCCMEITDDVPYSAVLRLPSGSSCTTALKGLKVEDAEGRNFQHNDDLDEWFEVFQDDCLLQLLASGTPLRLGYLHGQRAARAEALAAAEDGEVLQVVKKSGPTALQQLHPRFTPASWDVRMKPNKLPQLTRAATWRPSCTGRPIVHTTLPDPSFQKPRLRPTLGALGELDARLRALTEMCPENKKQRLTMPLGFKQRLDEMALPKRVVPDPWLHYDPRMSRSKPLLPKVERKSSYIPGEGVCERYRPPPITSQSVPRLRSPKSREKAVKARKAAAKRAAKAGSRPQSSSPEKANTDPAAEPPELPPKALPQSADPESADVGEAEDELGRSGDPLMMATLKPGELRLKEDDEGENAKALPPPEAEAAVPVGEAAGNASASQPASPAKTDISPEAKADSQPASPSATADAQEEESPHADRGLAGTYASGGFETEEPSSPGLGATYALTGEFEADDAEGSPPASPSKTYDDNDEFEGEDEPSPKASPIKPNESGYDDEFEQGDVSPAKKTVKLPEEGFEAEGFEAEDDGAKREQSYANEFEASPPATPAADGAPKREESYANSFEGSPPATPAAGEASKQSNKEEGFEEDEFEAEDTGSPASALKKQGSDEFEEDDDASPPASPSQAEAASPQATPMKTQGSDEFEFEDDDASPPGSPASPLKTQESHEFEDDNDNQSPPDTAASSPEKAEYDDDGFED